MLAATAGKTSSKKTPSLIDTPPRAHEVRPSSWPRFPPVCVPEERGFPGRTAQSSFKTDPDDAFCLFIHHYGWTEHYYILHHHLVINIFMFSTFQDIIWLSFGLEVLFFVGGGPADLGEDHRRTARRPN